MQAGFIAYLLFQASRGVDAFFDARPPPDAATQYTAHNVAVLVQVRLAVPATAWLQCCCNRGLRCGSMQWAGMVADQLGGGAVV